MATSQDFVNWVCSDELESDYLKYILLAEQRSFLRFASGTTHQTVYFPEVKAFHVCLPPLPEQRAIAHILGTLDDKIELNRRMNEMLEEMARALFKSWFLDFDPVWAKVEGRWRPGESLPGLPTDLYDLFPDQMVESELGEVPEGWKVVPMEELVELRRETVKPQEHPDELFAHYSLPAFDDGRRPFLEAGQSIKSNKHAVARDAVLISKLNPRIPRVWYSNPSGEQRAVCSTEFLVIVPRVSGHRPWVYGLLDSGSFQRGFESLVTGTSGSHQRVRRQAFAAMPVVKPSHAIVDSFVETAAPMLERTHAARLESDTLSALRDTLLPKLISGDLRIPDAERLAGEAT